MAQARIGNSVIEAFIAEDLVPRECVDIELLMPADGMFQLRYTVAVDDERIARLIKAFARLKGASER